MRYLLSPSEAAFKSAVREFAGRFAPGIEAGGRDPAEGSDRLDREMRSWLASQRPSGLSRVEEIIALEEIVRRRPESCAALVSGGAFKSLGPDLLRAAADIGTAQGLLARELDGLSSPAPDGRAARQAACDVVSDLEAARLVLYREALLEDAGRGDPEAVDRLGRQAEALSRRARALRSGS